MADARPARWPMRSAPAPPHRGRMASSARARSRRVLSCLALAWTLAACSAAATTQIDSTTSATARQADAPAVEARAYAVYDEHEGRLLASGNADDRRPVRSLMKLLNAVVAYRAAEPERVVVAPDGLG